MKDLDLIQHFLLIQQHLWVLKQSSAHLELEEATVPLEKLIKSLLYQDAIVQAPLSLMHF